MQTPSTLRDQIALDIYKHAVSGYQRFFPIDKHAEVAEAAYHATDAFLSEMAKQAPSPEAPVESEPDTPAEERKTVTPKAGKRYYMRTGENVKIEWSGKRRTPFRALYGGLVYHYYFPDGRHESNPRYDLVEESKTIPPVAGKHYFTRSGDVVEILHSAFKKTPFVGVTAGQVFPLYFPDGRHKSNPRYDLVEECQF